MGDGARAQMLALGDGPELRAEAEALASAALAGDLAGRPWSALLERAGAPGRAARAEVDAAFAAERELIAKRDRRRSETEHAERARRVQRRASKRALDLGLQLVGLWFRDLAARRLGRRGRRLRRRSPRPRCAPRPRAATPPRFRRAVELVEETRQLLQLNVSEELAVEALAYRLEGEVARVAVA